MYILIAVIHIIEYHHMHITVLTWVDCLVLASGALAQILLGSGSLERRAAWAFLWTLHKWQKVVHRNIPISSDWTTKQIIYRLKCFHCFHNFKIPHLESASFVLDLWFSRHGKLQPWIYFPSVSWTHNESYINVIGWPAVRTQIWLVGHFPNPNLSYTGNTFLGESVKCSVHWETYVMYGTRVIMRWHIPPGTQNLIEQIIWCYRS